MRTSAAFDAFWRDTGQFLTPCGAMRSQEALDAAKRIASGVFEEMEKGHRESESANQLVLDNEFSKFCKLQDKLHEIQKVLRDSDCPSKDKVWSIERILNEG